MAPCSVAAALAQPGFAQTQQAPAPRPEPVEIPIGTEANAPIDEITDLTLLPKQRLPASLKLKIGTWNLAARKPGETAIAPQKPETPKKNWRHTFGAERTTAQWRELDKGGFGADIIALQGVKSMRTVSRLFNARRYHIIASRQLLARSTVNSSGIAVFRADAPATTAVAFRRRRGVRIAGFRHFLPRHVKQGVEPVAITAFRLRIYRKDAVGRIGGYTIWLPRRPVARGLPAPGCNLERLRHMGRTANPEAARMAHSAWSVARFNHRKPESGWV